MENEQEISYSKALAELESIIAKMQSPDCDIDLLSGYTTRALNLLRICKEKLLKTDEELKKCLAELDA